MSESVFEPYNETGKIWPTRQIFVLPSAYNILLRLKKRLVGLGVPKGTV